MSRYSINKKIYHYKKGQGITMLLVEQNARMALKLAARGYVLETGRIVLTDTGRNLLGNESVKKAYLGEFAETSYYTNFHEKGNMKGFPRSTRSLR